MTTYVSEIEVKAGMLRAQITEMQALARDIGASVEDAARPYFRLLEDLYVRDLPLARMLSRSDLVVHAEGPAVADDSPKLAAFNWLAGIVQKSLRTMSVGLFDLLDRDARTFMRLLDLRLTGMAPGSLYLGFAVAPPDADSLLSPDEPVFQRVREAMRQLPEVTAFIDDESIDPELHDLLPDPAQRDNALSTLLKLSPTGRIGIHTLDIASPGSKSGQLSQRERVVLKAAMDRPQLRQQKSGTFSGELLEIDLSSNRFHVRHIPTIGSLRCVAPPGFNRAAAKAALGEQVRVHGLYEADRSGKPRLMLVQSLEPLPAPRQDVIKQDMPSV